jgi:hypothetical protein
MEIVKKNKWYKFFKLILCRVGIHEWKKMKYRKKNRTLIVWEECCVCKKVKEG